MVRLFFPKDWDLNGYISCESYGLSYKISHDRGYKSGIKERPKLIRVDFIFYRGSPASLVEPSALNEVLTSSLRLASLVWIIFEDPQPSCPSFPLRGSCHKLDTTFGGIFPSYRRGCRIEDHLRWSSSILRLGEAPVMMWHYFAVGIGGLCSHKMCLGDFAPEAIFADEKSLTTKPIIFEEECVEGVDTLW